MSHVNNFEEGKDDDTPEGIQQQNRSAWIINQ
jgi:hypothetical protein